LKNIGFDDQIALQKLNDGLICVKQLESKKETERNYETTAFHALNSWKVRKKL
jgi:hypothetical protein